jgi:hypothetical protein
MEMEFGAILSGIAGRGREPQHKPLIEYLAISIA